MPFLTLEQVDTLSLEQAQRALKLLTKTYKLDAPIQEYMTPELWDCLDQLCDTLLYLEDRIDYLKMIDKVTKANQVRWSTDKVYIPEMDDPLIEI